MMPPFTHLLHETSRSFVHFIRFAHFEPCPPHVEDPQVGQTGFGAGLGRQSGKVDVLFEPLMVWFFDGLLLGGVSE
jgi:hypothetical protein